MTIVPARAGEPGRVRDLTSGSLHRAIWYLAPVMALETGILNVADLLDIYWVSRLGSAALAASSISLVVRWLVNSVTVGLGIGGLAFVSRRVGGRDCQDARHAATQAIWLALLAALLIGTAGQALVQPILGLLGADNQVRPLAATYLHILFAGAAAWVLVQVINALFRGAGEARLALRVLLLTVAVNVISEPFLVLGLGPLPGLGIAGSPAAFCLGFACGLAMQLVVLFRGRAAISLNLRHLRPDLRLMGRIAGIALPSTAQFALRATATMVVLSMVSAYGTFATAAYGLADRFMVLILVPCFGLGNAASTLVGQNMGAGQPDRAARSTWWVSVYAVTYLLALLTILFLFAEPLIALFDPTPAVVAIGSESARIIAFAIVFDGLGFVLGRGLDGAGNTLPAAAINLLTLWVVQLPAAWFFSQGLGLGLTGIWYGRALAYVTNGLLFVFWFRRGRWKRRKV